MRGTANWVVGGGVSVLGLVGLFAASRAVDAGFYGFGLALFGFAVLFVFSLVKGAFDAREKRVEPAHGADEAKTTAGEVARRSA